MITELKIENYKSIQDLTLEVGRVNVLIGENGCGKSNILEAITFAAAAEANKLDNEFLFNRGIRVTEPKLMRSAFEINQQDIIKIRLVAALNNIGGVQTYTLKNDNKPYSTWVCDEKLEEQRNLKLLEKIDWDKIKARINEDDIPEDYDEEAIERAFLTLANTKNKFHKFLIYSPENTMLRDFSKEANIEPLGDKGEGLLKLLIYTQHEAKQSQDFNELNDIKETLELFGWYESIVIPNDFSQLEKKITIQDRYLGIPFDQRSANEGFLLVLFYITLVVSKYTPKIFAIDNLDTSLNPKLCTKLIKELARLAKKYDKQMFVTTHNPAILDGIDLGDEEQRLFVVSRNDDGHTCCDRITLKDKPKSSTRAKISRVFKNNEDSELFSKQDILNKFDDSEEPLKLSEALLRGYLGGLPEGF
jgi:predicted ATPase